MEICNEQWQVIQDIKLFFPQLIAGLYTFKIEVTGQNRVGEADVNVTVLPRKFMSLQILKPIFPLLQNSLFCKFYMFISCFKWYICKIQCPPVSLLNFGIQNYHSDHDFDLMTVNVALICPVLVATRKNSPPVAVINPKEQIVKLPNSAILDGSGKAYI